VRWRTPASSDDAKEYQVRRWSPEFARHRTASQPLSGTWLILGSGFLIVGLLWISLAYRFYLSAAPRALLIALVMAFLHAVSSMLNFRRGLSAFLLSLAAVLLGIVGAFIVRVYFLIAVEVIAGVVLVLGRSTLLSSTGRR
jgi:predicted ferric reductase